MAIGPIIVWVIVYLQSCKINYKLIANIVWHYIENSLEKECLKYNHIKSKIWQSSEQ